jgi:hypothetical protein
MGEARAWQAYYCRFILEPCIDIAVKMMMNPDESVCDLYVLTSLIACGESNGRPPEEDQKLCGGLKNLVLNHCDPLIRDEAACAIGALNSEIAYTTYKELKTHNNLPRDVVETIDDYIYNFKPSETTP